MIAGAADARIDRQILHRLHIELDAVHRRGGSQLEPADDLSDRRLARAGRLQLDQKPSAVQRHIGAVDADEGTEVGDIGILADDVPERPLSVGHRGEGNFLARLRNPLDRPRVLQRKKSLGNLNIKQTVRIERRDRRQQRQWLMFKDDVEGARILPDDPVESAFGGEIEAGALRDGAMAQELGAKHRHERQARRRRR